MSATTAVEMPEIGATGLTSKEVVQRIESGQSNAVKTSTSRSVQDIVRANVFTLFNGIIFAAMVLVLITGSWRDAVFGFVIIINTGIGIVTELRAKRTLDKLSILVASEFLVHRDGRDVEVPHNEIVLDDLLWIRAGEQVPADGQIIQTWGLELDESMLTGEWRQAVVSAVAGVVGMIPEGLVLLTSLNFAVAAMRLARHNTLVQELESVETLARVDALNLDKTGTITDGGIAFNRLVMLDSANAAAEQAATQALYDCCNEEQPNGTGQAVLAGLKAQGYGAGAVESRVPFSSARKWSAVRRSGETWYMGAPEVIISALEGDYSSVLQQVNEYANDGNRVLLVARSTAPFSPRSGLRDAVEGANVSDGPQLDVQAEPVALVLCSEKIREDAERTLAWFREQGVRCRVISGDNPVTVGAIARRVKLTGDHEPVAMDARELPEDVNELARVLENVDVLGRVLPDQKKAIVQALHTQNHVVAMTGDGVNDALAIKEADLGIAMGNAAPATKAVAQVVLVDSKFSHLPDVVARGRQVMANMERVASLFLVKTVYSALISLGVVLTQIPYPYLPRHITYIGALTIGMPAFILALAPNTRRYIPGFLKRVVTFALPGGIATALSVLLAAWVLPPVMGWNVTGDAADLSALRATSAIILFAMGVFVLARVARPLNGWRGVLVAVFAAAGVIGAFVPFVANFFALILPTGATMVATLIALAGSALIFALCLWLAPFVRGLTGKLSRRH